jgi:hypothetical protein
MRGQHHVGYAIAVTPQWNKRRLLPCNAHPAALVLPDGWQGFLSMALGGHGCNRDAKKGGSFPRLLSVPIECKLNGVRPGKRSYLVTVLYDVNSHEISRIRQREFSQGSAGNRENESAGNGPIDLKGNSQVARAGFVFYGQCGR